MAVFTETIKLEDQVSAPAKQASGAMASAGKAMGGLSKATFDAANAMKVGKESIGAAIGGIKSAFTSLASGDVKGAIAGVTDAVAGMAKLLDLAVPGLGQAVSAVIQIAGGLVGITVGLIKSGVEFAIASSEAKQQMLGLFDAMGGGITTGLQMEAVIDDLKAKYGISKDALIGYTNELQRMGMTNLDEIRDSLLAVSSAAALVKGGDQALLNFTKKIQLAKDAGIGLKIPIKGLAELSATGANVGDVAAAMGISVEKLTEGLKQGTIDAGKFGDALQEAIINKGKGPLERMAASSANLKKLLNESLGDLFEDIDVGPFMQEVKKLFDILGQGTASGQALKAGIGGFFKQVFETLTKVVPAVKHFFLDLVILGLKAYIAVKPIVAKIKEFGESAAGAQMITAVLSSLWEVLKVVGISIAVVVGALMFIAVASIVVATALWSIIGAVIGLAVDGFGLMISGLASAGTAIYDFVAGAVAAIAGWISGAGQAASDFVAGLVAGITAGAAQVIGAVKGLASAATGAFKSALGIKSPSRVMMGLGVHTGAGVAEGIESTEADVHGASSGLAAAAVKGASSDGGAAGGGKAAGGGAPVTVYVQIDGAGKSALEITQEMAARVFEQAALQAGV